MAAIGSAESASQTVMTRFPREYGGSYKTLLADRMLTSYSYDFIRRLWVQMKK